MILDVITLLAQGGASTVWVGSGIVGTAATILLVKHLSNRSIHLNGQKLRGIDVCDERHTNLGNTITEIKDSQRRMEDKLDDAIAARNPAKEK